MSIRCLFIFLMCTVPGLPVLAQVPHTFTPGQAASAEQVNANFAALVEQIGQLQAEIQAMKGRTMASLAGTYDFFELKVDVDQNGPESFNLAGATSRGTLILNADGSGSFQDSQNYRQLTFNVENIHVMHQSGSGSTIIPNVDINLGTDNEAEGPFPITWTLTNTNLLTLTAGDGGITLRAGGGGILVSATDDEEGQNQLSIAVRR